MHEILRLTTASKEAELASIEMERGLEELRLPRQGRDTIQGLRGELNKLRKLYWGMIYDYRDLQDDFTVLLAKFDTSIPVDDGNDSARLSRLVRKTPKGD
ncbi:hypothetical protein DL768_006717 [Monosporascus sp. mg162]|nr:hypothetical protein DL768_006717 [Monosporascus sp. mg162]